MKKILISLVVLVVAAVAAGPFLIGSQIEKVSKSLVEKSNQQMADLIKTSPQIQKGSLTIDSYEKSYLNSTAKGVFTIALAGIGESKDFTIPYTTEITHGPYLADAGFGLAKTVTRPDLSGLELSDSINADTVVIEGIVDFSQNMMQTMTIAPIKHVIEADGSTVNFAGAIINSKANVNNRSTFTSDMSVKALTITDDEESAVLSLKPFEMELSGEGDEDLKSGNYKAHSGVIEATMAEGINITLQKMAIVGTYKKAKGASELMLGDGELTLTELVIANPDALPMPIKVPELKVLSKIEQADNEDLSISVMYQGTLDKSMMTVMKSPVDVKTAELEIKFKAIPAKAVIDYQEMVKGLVADAENPAAGDEMQAKIFDLVKMLANNAASTQLKVLANATEGDLVADINAGFKPNVNLDEAKIMELLAAPSPAAILPLLVGKGDVSLSQGITDKAGLTPMIQMMASEYVTLKDETFTAEMQITDGQLMINGKALPLGPQ